MSDQATPRFERLRSTNRLEPLLTIREAAGMLGVSVPTVRRLIDRGELPAVYVSGHGGAVRVRPRVLRRFIADREAAA